MKKLLIIIICLIFIGCPFHNKGQYIEGFIYVKRSELIDEDKTYNESEKLILHKKWFVYHYVIKMTNGLLISVDSIDNFKINKKVVIKIYKSHVLSEIFPYGENYMEKTK